jgi:RPA family protein
MREPALRIFAGEYNESTCQVSGEGEKEPSYILTPLGAMVNRLFVVGVLTDVENVSAGGDMWRAHVSDPTGIYVLYAGQYQPKASSFLAEAETPSYVAVTGKARGYEPEPDVLFVSIRPETIWEVEADLRDYWIVETCRQTYQRLEAMGEAQHMSPPSVFKLRGVGYPPSLAAGVVAALEHYEQVDLDHYRFLMREALSHFSVGKIATTEEIDDAEKTVLAGVRELEGDEGALWDDIMEHGEGQGLERTIIEEALTSLLDKGLVYEPILGKLKTT